jgi:hypothetical protein
VKVMTFLYNSYCRHLISVGMHRHVVMIKQTNHELDSTDSESESGSETEEDAFGNISFFTITRLPCIAHSLQLTLKVIEKVLSYKTSIVKINKLVKKVRKSSDLTQKLFQKCGKSF